MAERESDELLVFAVRLQPPTIIYSHKTRAFLSLTFVTVYIRPPQAVLFLGTKLGT